MRPSIPSLRAMSGVVSLTCAMTLGLVAVNVTSAPPPAYAGTAPARAGNQSCSTNHLVIWIDTQGSGTAGSTYYDLEFTNLSGQPCTLLGFPKVAAVNLADHQLGNAASDNGSHQPFTVTLANGATAAAVLRVADVSNFPGSKCHAQTAAGLSVYPPRRTVAKIVPFPFRACSSTGPVFLSVQAVQKI